MDTEKSYIVGTIATTFFENPDNFFKIMLIDVSDTNTDWDENEIVVTGYFGDVSEEQEYKFTGQMVNHPKYGKQFKVDSYIQNISNDSTSLIKYFSSDLFPGIGPKTAEKLVDKLGSDAISKILKDDKALDSLHLSTDKKNMIIKQVMDNHEVEQVLLELDKLGLGNVLASKIYQVFHSKTLEVVMNNPYKLVEKINGIGFKKADNIAFKLGFEPNNPFRIRGAILHVLNVLSLQEGNVYGKEEELIDQTIELLSADSVLDKEIISQLEQLILEGQIVRENNYLYLKQMYDSEWTISASLYSLNSKSIKKFSDTEINDALAKIQKKFKVKYDNSQKEAIRLALTSSIFLLTGGPGTGKTTIINGIVATYSILNKISLDTEDYDGTKFPIALAAPTGRASKQMSDTTGLPAGTIHRLLGINAADDVSTAEVNEITANLIIIDEMSMVDMYLFKQLLNAITPGTQIILVGDKDQLPSVGPGQVFADIIESKILPSKELSFIYRQDEKSTITKLAHDINSGKINNDFFSKHSDRNFFECNATQLVHVIEQVFQSIKKKDFDIDNVQTLAPMYKGPAGIDNLNKVIQEILNPMKPNRKNVTFGDTNYRIGDKVVHLVNNSENNVYNGEIGIIKGITYAKDSVDHSDELHLNFSGQEITYQRSEWGNISLAYATSIHKAQGSEFDLVILPLVKQQKRMLKRNLLYTAVTRAKKSLVMLGDKVAYEMAVNDISSKRNTTLIKRLFKSFKIKKEEKENDIIEIKDISLTNEAILDNKIDPMIGMDNISPYDFL